MQRGIMAAIVGCFILLFWSIGHLHKKNRLYDIANIFSIFSLFTFIMTLFGVYFGYQVKNNRNLRQDIVIGEHRINDVAIILFTEKYVVLYEADKSVVTYPASLVGEVVSKNDDIPDVFDWWAPYRPSALDRKPAG
jgi:hypothetical protein